MAIVADKGIQGSQADRALSPRSARSTDAINIVPSDTLDLNPYPRSIYVGGAGVVTLMNQHGDTLAYTVPAGGTIQQVTKRVMATGTTATLMIGQV